VLTVSGKFQHGWVAGAGGGQNGRKKGVGMPNLGQVMGHAGL